MGVREGKRGGKERSGEAGKGRRRTGGAVGGELNPFVVAGVFLLSHCRPVMHCR